jgi:hypothetical protein
MNSDDMVSFVNLMNGIGDIYNKKDLFSDDVIQIYFSSLGSFTIDQVSSALSAHLSDSKHGTFIPKPADIIRQIKGAAPTATETIAMARNPTFPFGVLARIQIGSWDLNNIDYDNHNCLISRANEVLQNWDEMRDRCLAGNYSDHEISMMCKLEVSPAKPFAPGLLPPTGEVKRLIGRNCNRVIQTKRHAIFLGHSFDGDNDELKKSTASPEVQKFLSKI